MNVSIRATILVKVKPHQCKKMFASYRFNVEEQDFIEESRYVGKVRIESPVDTEVSDDDCPDRLGHEDLTPRHLT